MSGETVTMEVHVDLVLAVERMHAMRETILSGASKDPEGEIVETVKFVKGEIGAAGVGAMEDEELARDEKTVPCPECGKAAHRTRKDKPRRAMLMTGRVDYRRAVYECRGCGKLHAPLDGRLGLEGKETLTPRVQELAAWMVVHLNCEDSSRAIRRMNELAVLPKQVHRVLERAGERAVKLADAEVERLCAPVDPRRPLVPKATSSSPLVIEKDGVMVLGRDGNGHEVKSVTVYSLADRVVEGGERAPRKSLLKRFYGATARGLEHASKVSRACAVNWGLLSARIVILIADGAPWIWKWGRENLYRVLADGTQVVPVEILDFWHACQHLAEVAKALARRFGDKAEEWRARWYARWKEIVSEGGVLRLIAELREHESLVSDDKEGADESPRSILDRAIAYFTEHAERMRYDVFRAKGYPVASGAIEGACRHLVKERLDGPGMRWKVTEGIERILALRTLLFNGDWAKLWPHMGSLSA